MSMTHGSTALALIALGVGYQVFITASREKETRFLGRAIGIFIILSAVLCVLSAAGRTFGCPLFGKAPMCFFSAKQVKAPQ